MCQCNQPQENQLTASTNEDGMINGFGMSGQGAPVILNLHYADLGKELKEVEAAPGEVVVDNEFRVSHGRPESLIELVQMVEQLNKCNTYASEHTNNIISEAAKLSALNANMYRARTQEEVEDRLIDQREALAKIIVSALATFATTLQGREQEVKTDELTHTVLEFAGDYAAAAIAEQVETALDYTLKGMGLGPR